MKRKGSGKKRIEQAACAEVSLLAPILLAIGSVPLHLPQPQAFLLHAGASAFAPIVAENHQTKIMNSKRMPDV
jgi:hypothetical protein